MLNKQFYYRLSAYEGGEAKGDIVDSPTLRYVLREDQIKAKTGHTPDVKFYKEVREYGPGMVPLKAYKEEVDDVVPTSDFQFLFYVYFLIHKKCAAFLLFEVRSDLQYL